MYKTINSAKTGQPIGVVKQEGEMLLSIPFVVGNTDYQAYLKWVAEGNTPTPADEGTQ